MLATVDVFFLTKFNNKLLKFINDLIQDYASDKRVNISYFSHIKYYKTKIQSYRVISSARED